MNLNGITQQYFDVFPGDFSGNSMQRQTPGVVFATVEPVEYRDPKLILFNKVLAQRIGLGAFEEKDLGFTVAKDLPKNIQTYATAYAGHQFGNWAGQLGDGRAIFAGEIKDPEGNSFEIQWKGAGATPYSRFADGRAVLRSSLREYLMSEYMHHLGVPTTRALSLALTGEDVIRDILYAGNPRPEKGAVVIRVAQTFLRFGHFELLSAQEDIRTLKKMLDFTITQYFPEIIANKTEERYREFFRLVCIRTADLMVEWYRVGFVHGVMNTDNMSIIGLTIDYGPFSMLDEFNLNFTSNTTDLPGRRYAFGKQAQIAQWNLWQLANALFPLIPDQKFLENQLNEFNSYFWEKHDQMMLRKFGFSDVLHGDQEFIVEAQTLMQDLKLDFTLFFNILENVDQNPETQTLLQKISYLPYTEAHAEYFNKFIEKYLERKSKNSISDTEALKGMRKSNPKFCLRNYLLFDCVAALEGGDRGLLDKLHEAIQSPYEEKFAEFSVKRPERYDGVPGCSMLSCSS